MFFSAVVRKSLTDLSRRKARSFFTVLTLAIAVASVGIMSLNPLMDKAMKREVAANKLPDLTVSMKPLPLSAKEVGRLARLPNVKAVEPRTLFSTRVYVGARRDDALVVGVRDFAKQQADVVAIESGKAPQSRQVLTDRNNKTHNSFKAEAGGTARILGANGSVIPLRVSGVGRNLTGGDSVVGGSITFYTDVGSVARLSGTSGYTSLGFRLRDNSKLAAERTVAAVRQELRTHSRFTAFDDLPVIQDPGGYPGKAEFEKLGSVFSAVTLLALLTALVLVSNTMSTLIGEQTGEIAALKAIGARRRDIRRIYLRTTALFGLLGAVFGSILGVVLANLLVVYFAQLGFGISAAWSISVPILVVSILVGLFAPPLAALPAIRHASRLPLQEALQASGSAVGGQGRVDAFLRHASALPRTAQIGLRGLGRRKRRTLATTLQVALAVATLLALLSLGSGVTKITGAWFDDNHFDIWAMSVASKPFDPAAAQVVRETPGVAAVQPWMNNQLKVDGRDAQGWGLPLRPMIATHVTDGRWYSAAELRSHARVAVIGKTLSKKTGAGVGEYIPVQTAGGKFRLRVVGVSGNQADNGMTVFMPATTLQRAVGADPGTFNSYWIRTTSANHGLIDRTTTRIEDRLAAHGNQIATRVSYDLRQKQIAFNATITRSITILGLLIVAISMVGLINAITMAVLERTREIGMLRSIGARARDVRRIFATEGLALALAGWIVGVPLGYGLARLIGSVAGNAVGLDIAFVFPLGYVAIALIGTIVLALLVMLAPLRRAVRFKPGEAIRYA